MPPEVTCPACQYRPQAAGGPVCPHCGGALPRAQVRPAFGEVQAAPPAPLPTVRCPACGREVAELCLLCPHCDEPLAERHRVRRTDDPQGARRTRALVTLVAVGAGVAVTWSLVVLDKAAERGGGLAVVLGVAILLAAAVVFGVFLPTRFRSPYEEQATVGSAFLAETLGPLGCFGLVVLSLLTVIFSLCAG